jgi:replicative DNA helicase
MTMNSPEEKAVSSEYAVIGGLLLDNSRLSEIDLDASDFLIRANAKIFDAIVDLVNDDQDADAVSVADFLEKSDRVKGERWLPITVGLANNTATAANVLTYARIVRDESTRRKALAVAENLKVGLRDGTDAVDEAIKELMLLAAPKRTHDCTVKQAVSGALDEIERAFNAKGALTGISTGLLDMDSSLGGLHRSDLVVIGARPSVGKTAFMLNLADNAGVPVGIVSGEQGRDQVGLRLIAKNGRLNAHRLRVGKIEDDEWNRTSLAVGKLVTKQIFINDKPNPSIDDVMRQARKWKFQYDIKALYIDYLQRIRTPAIMRAPRHEQVGHVALSLKELARELDIPVIALAQVNRNVEDRVNRRPNMADLKDSGSIEQEADVIALLYRDDVHDPDSSAKGIIEINIAKNRHGPTGMIKCLWHAESMTVANLYGGAA